VTLHDSALTSALINNLLSLACLLVVGVVRSLRGVVRKLFERQKTLIWYVGDIADFLGERFGYKLPSRFDDK
jgi:hypothetical protein